jgi:DNA repair protein RecO (recombination protein O)
VEDLETTAFTLRTRAFGESDLIAVFLTSDHGKLSGIARGAKRSKNRFPGPALEPFHEVRLRFARRPHSELAFLHECRVVTSHHGIAASVEAFAWASYLSELTEAVAQPGDAAPELFSIFRETMARLAAGETPEPLAHHFILTLLDIAGWRPDFERCGICDEAVVPAIRPLLDPRGSGVICARHEAERSGHEGGHESFRPSRRIIDGALLGYIAQAREDASVADASVLRAATALLDRLIDLNLQRKLKSRRFLAEIRASPST